MACPWCYIPFSRTDVEAQVCLDIVKRSSEIGMSVITFGGGDPFIYPFFPELALHAKRNGLFVHVDTNAIAMRKNNENWDLVKNTIDLFGLPIDGPNATTHGRMRLSPRHFDIVIDALRWLLPFRPKTKINTIVTKLNANVLPEMVELIATLGPFRWSIYQYWPLSLGQRVEQEHGLDDHEFTRVTREITKIIEGSGLRIEANSLLSRHLTYPFVSHDGTLYVHSQTMLREYDVIGSIFDDSAIRELFRRCGPERAEAMSRYAKR